MKLRKTLKKPLVLIVASGVLALGCELIVDFDRTKIPTETTDAPPGSVSAQDATLDTFQPDTFVPDAADAADTDADADAADARDGNDGGDP